jgi:GT2 family glycosyltransferase
LHALSGAVCGVSEGVEVIVSDDDGSEETQSFLQREFPNVIYIRGPRRGPAANRNSAAAAAKGEWLVFTDDDCLPLVGWLRAYREAIAPGCEVYEGKTTCQAGLKSALQRAPANMTGGYLWSCNMMISAKLFRETGGFDVNFPYAAMEDVDLRERLRDRGDRIVFTPDAVVDHPPRPIRSVAELLREHESFYFYKIVKRGEQPRLLDVLYRTAKTRIRCCNRPQIFDLPRAVALYSFELAIVCIKSGSWLRRYRHARAQ